MENERCFLIQIFLCTGGKSGGETNEGFVPSADDKDTFTVETEKAEKKEGEEKEEKKDEDPPPPAE